VDLIVDVRKSFPSYRYSSEQPSELTFRKASERESLKIKAVGKDEEEHQIKIRSTN